MIQPYGSSAHGGQERTQPLIGKRFDGLTTDSLVATKVRRQIRNGALVTAIGNYAKAHHGG
jgi:hypothetical protein